MYGERKMMGSIDRLTWLALKDVANPVGFLALQATIPDLLATAALFECRETAQPPLVWRVPFRQTASVAPASLIAVCRIVDPA